MREFRVRAEALVKIVCLLLALLVAWELRGIVLRWNPFHGVTVPELPALATTTNLPATAPAGGKAITRAAANTNPPSATGTQLATLATNNPITNVIHQVEAAIATTNTTPAPDSLPTQRATNVILAATNTATNDAAMATNVSDLKPRKHPSGTAAMPEMAGRGFNPGGPPGKNGADLPPAVQARIARIIDSEIIAPVMHPLPMALLGIAGEFAFLRADSGQTGLVKEGDSLADLKLLRIGVNRVLIEQDGQKKELLIFSGYGGESLLPNDSTNENNHP